MKTLQILEIIILAVIVVMFICLIFTEPLKTKIKSLESKVTILENNYRHLLHRINAIEYPEVLGKENKKASNSDG